LSTDLEAVCPDANVHIFATGNVAFFLIVHPSQKPLNKVAIRVGQQHTDDIFVHR
jgi:hypothetical protein